MSTPASTPASTAPQRHLPALDPDIGLICIAADSLIPLFRQGTIDTSLARHMAMSAIEAYAPESRADAVNIARTIAFSMAAIALLGSAGTGDLTMTMKLRAYGRANTLNRSADQSERTMMQRRRYQRTHAAEYQQEQPAEPDMQTATAEIRAAVAEALHYAATAPKTEAPAAKPMPQPAAPVSKAAPQPAAPVSSIHHTAPKTNPAPAGSFKASLLCESALQRVLDQDPSLLPAFKATHSNPAGPSTSAANLPK